LKNNAFCRFSPLRRECWPITQALVAAFTPLLPACRLAKQLQAQLPEPPRSSRVNHDWHTIQEAAEDLTMDDRKQQARAQDQSGRVSKADAQKVVLAPPSAEEEKFLQSIERTIGAYNPDVIVGGPRNFRS
jgi:hypothetical protein